MKPEVKKCGESCGCSGTQKIENKTQTTSEQTLAKTDKIKSTEESAAQKPKLDPTHFGDWQINGRAIDF